MGASHMYPQILQTIKQKITHIVSAFHLNLNHKSHPQGRHLKIKNEDALALALYRHASTRVTKKSVWDDFKGTFRCSYKTLVASINRVAIWSMKILFLIMRLGKKYGHIVKCTDATDLPVCLKKNADSHCTMQGLAGFGHSAKGWYYGLKMTMTRDRLGNILGLRFTAPSANDRDIFRSINSDIFGAIVADAGYVSKKLERDMYIEGKRWVLIRPYKTMKKLCAKWQERLYRSRFQIEFDFRSMKMFHGLVTSLPRSVNGYLAHYLNSILSFVIA
jgi:hypothetical protein